MLAVTLILLLGVLFRGQSEPERCPQGYTCNHAFKECWKNVENPANFGEAREICARQGGDLLSLHTRYKMAEMKKTLNLESWYYFVGAWFWPRFKWEWVDGSRLDKTVWSAGPPKKHTMYCGAVERLGYLTGAICRNPLPFLCHAGSCSAP